MKDKQQFLDTDNEARDVGINDTLWSIFGVVWPASYILADIMTDYDLENRTILEVGCGIALSSLVLNKRKANITATDYHPESQNFLSENVKLNNGKSINFFLSDWNELNPQLGKFDLIIGSDILYEETHPKLLSNFINQHSQDHCEVIIASHDRGYQNKFNELMINNSFSHEIITPKDQRTLVDPFRGHVHKYNR